MSNDVLGGLIAIAVVIVVYAIYLGILLVFLWVAWNWIVVPTLPYIAGIFA